jgi:FkbM family methyltransferase
MSVRLSRLEVAALAALLAAVAIVAAARYPWPRNGPTVVEDDLIESLRVRFAPPHSQGPEEWLIRDFFNDRRGGTFLDVGAFDPIRYSNTYTLEHDLGWRGIAIDAIAEFAPRYASTRPGARFVAAFVGDQDGGLATLFLDPDSALVASGDQSFTARFTSKAAPRQVPRRTLDSILREQGVTKVDFVSLDIELGEPAALAAFDLATYRPELLCIEAHGQTRQAVLNHLARAGYVVVGRYLRADPVNLYFTPLANAGSLERRP